MRIHRLSQGTGFGEHVPTRVAPTTKETYSRSGAPMATFLRTAGSKHGWGKTVTLSDFLDENGRIKIRRTQTILYRVLDK